LEFYIEEWSLESLFRKLSFISKIPAIKTLLWNFHLQLSPTLRLGDYRNIESWGEIEDFKKESSDYLTVAVKSNPDLHA